MTRLTKTMLQNLKNFEAMKQQLANAVEEKDRAKVEELLLKLQSNALSSTRDFSDLEISAIMFLKENQTARPASEPEMTL